MAATVSPTATFSEALDATTVNATTVTLTDQATSTAVAGTVGYDAVNRIATFSPNAALGAGKTYLARIKGGATGVKDVAGNALAADATWTFTVATSTGGTTSYLSDLAYSVAANGWGPVEKDRSNGENAAGDGKPLTLAGVVYAKGLGAHAASEIDYTMSACTSFSAKVGVDDEVGTKGTVVFQVWADGTKLYDSGTLTGSSPTATVSVDVTGRTALQLIVTNADGDNSYDHADWADAKLTCGGGTTDGTPPTVTATTPANGASGVAATVSPTATFSEALNATTVNATTVTLTDQATSTAVAGTAGYDTVNRIATFSPNAALGAGKTYLARIKGGASGVKDVAGNALAADATWTFTVATSTGGTTSYLSDLAYSVAANGWGPVEKDRSNGENAAGDGKPLTLAGVVYAKGLGAHAASEIDDTMSACTSFSAKVGVDDEVGTKGTVVFQVWADGTKLYDSGTLTGSSPTATVSVDVTGRTALQLIVTNADGDNSYDHADWADAKLTCG